MRCHRVAAARNSQFGHVTTSFVVVEGHFERSNRSNRAESESISGTDSRKVISMAVKTCSDQSGSVCTAQATVLEMLKIVFNFFWVPGITF